MDNEAQVREQFESKDAMEKYVLSDDELLQVEAAIEKIAGGDFYEDYDKASTLLPLLMRAVVGHRILRDTSGALWDDRKQLLKAREKLDEAHVNAIALNTHIQRHQSATDRIAELEQEVNAARQAEAEADAERAALAEQMKTLVEAAGKVCEMSYQGQHSKPLTLVPDSVIENLRQTIANLEQQEKP